MPPETTRRKPGQGTICHGYLRRTVGGKRFYSHRALEGDVPSGCVVHHRNGNKLDNRPNNRIVLTREEHGLLHAGWTNILGRWFRPCPRCGRWLERTRANWFLTPGAR